MLNGILMALLGLLPFVMGIVCVVLYRSGALDLELNSSGAKTFFLIFFVLMLVEIGIMLHVFSMV